MTPTVGLVTDTVACIPADAARALAIRVVPVHLLVDDEDHLDGDLDDAELHRRVGGGSTATTATPSPEEFTRAYRDVADMGRGAVLAVTVSGALSNVYNAAVVGARHSPIPTEVVDSRTAASAQGLIVTRLAEVAAQGATLPELVEAFPLVRAATGLIAAVPELRYLARSGRVPNVVARIGDRLDVKPLIEIGDDGKAHLAGVARSLSRARERLIEKTVVRLAGVPSRVIVVHTLAHGEAVETAAELRTRLPEATVDVSAFTAVMGVHTGPGLLGMAWSTAVS